MFEFNVVIFLYQLGIFLVFAICVTVIYKTLLAPVLRERRERIEGDMARAAAERAEAGQLKAKYEEKMSEVGEEASAILKRVNEEAAQHREELLTQTRRQADALLQKAEELIAMEEAQAVAKIRAEMADLAADVAARVLEETRTPERERALAEKFLAELEERHSFERRLES
ncbi:MAG: ATP synthase F0 subunit B [Candidatus Coatesbacteria bacterium]|nr:MAG: ATP synthase F0 subunit B [Candidatus Coatesbacteria bacterium]